MRKLFFSIAILIPLYSHAYMCNGNTNQPEDFYGFIECRPDYPVLFDGSDTSKTSTGKEMFLQKWMGKQVADMEKIIGKPKVVTAMGTYRWLLVDPKTSDTCLFQVDAPSGVIMEWAYFQTDRACDRYFKPLYRQTYPDLKLKVIFPETGK